MIKNSCRYIVIFGLSVLLLFCVGAHKNKLQVPKPEVNGSFKGKAKLKIIGSEKTISCTMMYCYNADKNEYISEFVGPMFKNLGVLSVNSKELFFYIRETQSYIKTNTDASSFSRITGLEIEPLSFVKLFRGKFDALNLNLKKSEITEQYIINYYVSPENMRITERANKNDGTLNALFFYKEDKMLFSIELKYLEGADVPSSLDIDLKSAHLKMTMEIKNQSSIGSSECEAPDVTKLEQSTPIDSNHYDASYPLILDLLP